MDIETAKKEALAEAEDGFGAAQTIGIYEDALAERGYVIAPAASARPAAPDVEAMCERLENPSYANVQSPLDIMREAAAMLRELDARDAKKEESLAYLRQQRDEALARAEKAERERDEARATPSISVREIADKAVYAVGVGVDSVAKMIQDVVNTELAECHEMLDAAHNARDLNRKRAEAAEAESIRLREALEKARNYIATASPGTGLVLAAIDAALSARKGDGNERFRHDPPSS